jgi:rSAM/selenodomain-associated transferase 1
MTPQRALVVVAKTPASGQTKTRLTPPLTGEQASGLYECFLHDTLEIIRATQQQIALTPIICYLPQGDEDYFRQLAPDFELLLQRGNNLSERLDNATTHCLKNDYDQVVIMDSDSPTLPVTNLIQAFTALEQADVSLGPCADGGYYCIGLKQPASSLFLQVTMSTDHVVPDTLAQAAAAQLSVELLPGSYDIDYAADLKHLIGDLNLLPDTVAGHTRAFLAENLSDWDVV